jgi:hypothetical protein
MYGPAEPAMKEYFELMMNRWENVPWDSAAGRVSGLPVDQLYQKTYPREIRQKLQELEARARGLAGTGTVWRQRVDYVTAAHQEFYKEGDTADRLGRGSVLMIERGAPKAVDGKLDDECWRREGGCFVTRNTGEALPYQSRVMAVYDDRALYVAARFDEPEMAGLVAEAKMQDEASWAEDSFEIFLSPREYPEHYVQMAINTLETLSDGWKPAIAVFKDEKNFKIERRVIREAGAWTIEVKIPYAELECAAPVPGTVWRGNFIWNRGKFSQKGLFAFSPTLGQSNHKTQFFGTLIFTDLDRFREDFGADAGMRWTASVRQGEVSDPDARAQMDLANGVGTLHARMSKSSHLAETLTRPHVTVKKGDLLEIRYRLPRKNQGDWMRLETCFMLEAPGEKPAYGWLADNRKSVSAGMVTFVVDLFAVTRVTAPEASLTSLSMLLSSEGGEENELEIDWVRVSPHTILTVESPPATPPEETAAPDPGPRAVQP